MIYTGVYSEHIGAFLRCMHCESFYVYIRPPVQQHIYRKCVLISHLTIQMMVAATEGGLNTIGEKK